MIETELFVLDIKTVPVLATVKLSNVPMVVISGCDGVWIEPKIPFPTYNFCAIPTPPFNTKDPVLILLESTFDVKVTKPDTLNEVNVPRLLILGWEFETCAIVPINVVEDNELIPVILELASNTNALLAVAVPAVTPARNPIAVILNGEPAIINEPLILKLPVTLRLDNVPIFVILWVNHI